MDGSTRTMSEPEKHGTAGNVYNKVAFTRPRNSKEEITV
jgi:hypothetical protein